MSLINDSILLLINVLHLIVILFVVGAPFSNSNYLLFMHAIIVPFIIAHWVLNNNTCSLTLAERYIRNKTYGVDVKDDDCFTYKFIAPIYDFNKNHEAFSYFTYALTIGLWSISAYTLIDKVYTGEITNYRQLALL
jgi:hypothetical protein